MIEILAHSEKTRTITTILTMLWVLILLPTPGNGAKHSPCFEVHSIFRYHSSRLHRYNSHLLLQTWLYLQSIEKQFARCFTSKKGKRLHKHFHKALKKSVDTLNKDSISKQYPFTPSNQFRYIFVIISPYASLHVTSVGEQPFSSSDSRAHRLRLRAGKIWKITASHPYAITRQFKIYIPTSGTPILLNSQHGIKNSLLSPSLAGRENTYELRARLVFKPVILSISCNINRSNLFVNHKLYGWVGKKKKTFRIPWQKKAAIFHMKIAISHQGYQTWTRTFATKPGIKLLLNPILRR